MIKIIVLNGNPTAGKNTFAELVEGYYPVIDHISYVDFTRNMLGELSPTLKRWGLRKKIGI